MRIERHSFINSKLINTHQGARILKTLSATATSQPPKLIFQLSNYRNLIHHCVPNELPCLILYHCSLESRTFLKTIHLWIIPEHQQWLMNHLKNPKAAGIRLDWRLWLSFKSVSKPHHEQLHGPQNSKELLCTFVTWRLIGTGFLIKTGAGFFILASLMIGSLEWICSALLGSVFRLRSWSRC